MAHDYDVIVIGGGLRGLTAATLVAQSGRKTLLVERNHDVGGAASTYKVGNLVVEAALHKAPDPRNPIDPKHHVITRLGVLEDVDWIPTGTVYEVRGGPVGEPFVLPKGFAQARSALVVPSARAGIGSVLGDMERIATSLGTLSKGPQAFRDPIEALRGSAPWRRAGAYRLQSGLIGAAATTKR
jgi:phytoene dehydrogenase-like protein